MLVVAGLSLKNLQPRVWDADSPYHLAGLEAVMISYADFHRMPARKRAAMATSLHQHLGVPDEVKVYLDNGAFYFMGRDGETPKKDYEDFVTKAKPDWYPIPQDFIPTPKMSEEEQRDRFTRTMAMNLAYQSDGYVPVVHIGRFLEEFTLAVTADGKLSAKTSIALGGIVPNLLRAPKAIPYEDILVGLRHVRETFAGKKVHVFGIGGTATLHLAALLGMDSADSSGWRNRAARGIVQLAGCGDRVVANLGNWRGREPSKDEWGVLEGCGCPACRSFGVDGLKASGLGGFCNRATHNLWVLLEEARWIEERIAEDTYAASYKQHLVNSIYLPLIDQVVARRRRDQSRNQLNETITRENEGSTSTIAQNITRVALLPSGVRRKRNVRRADLRVGEERSDCLGND